MSVFFSVIIPTYNRAHLIDETISHILIQTFKDFELIIIDDGSTDNTNEIISCIDDSRIIYYKNLTNIERSASRNKGVELSKGKFIAFCDSDDLWKHNHLELLYQEIQNQKEAEGLYFTGMIWNFPDRKQEVIFPKREQLSKLEYVIKYQICPTTTAFNSNILKKEQFNISLNINEDVELFSRILAKYNLFRIPIATVDVIIHESNTKKIIQDYITPQINVMKMIFNNPTNKDYISKSFAKEKIKSLKHELILHLEKKNEKISLIKELIKFIFLYPFDKNSKIKITLLIYSLPGGNLVKKTYRKFFKY